MIEPDASSFGGTTAYSENTASAIITVTPVNDAATFEVGDGSVTTDVGVAVDFAQTNSVITLPDGKILAIGSLDSGTDEEFVLTRYNADGSLDTTFGDNNDGIVITTVGASTASAQDAVVQADGKIVVVGGAGSDTAVVRYNSDGSLDTTFGGGTGIVVEDIGSQSATDRGNSVALTSDGKILVGGSANDGSQTAFALTRFNSDGTLDTTFDGDGTVTTAITISDTANDIVVQQDGTILLTGSSLTSTAGFNFDIDFSVVKYNSDGSLDTSFSDDGILTTAISTGIDVPNGIVVQDDGKILAAGYSNNGSNDDFAIVRYASDGTLDDTFGVNGVVTTPIGTGSDFGFDLALQSDGKIVVAGLADNGTDDDFAVLRYNSDGTLDNTFGDGNGIVTTPGTGQAFAVSIDDDGQIVLAGTDDNADIQIVRYNTDGSLDQRFGTFTDSLDGNPTFTEDGPAVVLDADVSIFDAELSETDDFGGSTLTLTRNGGVSTDDVFSAASGLTFNGTTTGDIVLASSGTVGTYSNTGGTLVLTFAAGTTNAEVNEVMGLIAYSNINQAPPASVQIDWVFNDGNDDNSQGSGGELSVTGSTFVDITAVNDAPISNGATFTLTDEEGDGPATFFVGSFASSGSSDPDGDSLGVAVTGISGSGGTLQFSVDGGATYKDLGTLSETSALLLRPTDRVRFTPDDDNGGTVVLTYRLWDQTSGSVEDRVDVTTNGGTTPYAAVANTVNVVVAEVNDAPSGADNTITIDEDAAHVLTISDFGFTDVEPNNFDRVVITSIPTDGLLFLDAGTSPDGTSTSAERVAVSQEISVSDIIEGRLIFAPGSNDNGTGYASFTFQVADDGGTANGGEDIDPTANTITFDVTSVDDSPSGITAHSENVLLSEDFNDNDSTDWTFPASYSVSGGHLNSGTNNDAQQVAFYNPAGAFDWTDVTFSTDITIGDDDAIGVVLRYEDANNYVALFVNGNDGGTPVYRIFEMVGGTFSFVAGADAPEILQTQTLTLTATVIGDDYSLQVNGDEVLSATITGHDSGTVGTFGNFQSDSSWDNLLVTRPELTVAESAANDTVVGTATGFDNDAGDTLTYSLTNDAGGRFKINSSGQILVADGTLLTPASGTSHTITIEVNDGTTTPYSEDFTIALNEAPVAQNTNDDDIFYTENGAPVQITDTITFTDVDDTNLESAIVRISSGLASSEDVLDFTSQFGITGSYNAGNGTLTLTGSATLAQYETVIRSVTYANTSDNPSTSDRTIQISVNDGDVDSGTQSFAVVVDAVNDAPVVTGPENATAAESGSLTFNTAGAGVIDTFDVDGDNLTVTLTADHASIALAQTTGLTLIDNDGSDGTLQFSGTQANIDAALDGLDYDSQAGYNGSATLVALVDDGNLTDSTTVAITVTPGQTIFVWDGGGTTNDWSDAANWDHDLVPGADDIVIFDVTSSKNATVDAAFAGSVSEIIVTSDYSGDITLARTLNVSGAADFHGTGTLNAVNQILDVDGDFTATIALNIQNATLNFGGDVDVTPSGTNLAGSLWVLDGTGDQTVNLPSLVGTLEFASLGTVTIASDLRVFEGITYTSGTVDLDGHTTTLTGNFSRTIDAEGIAFDSVVVSTGGAITVIGDFDIDGDLTLSNVGSISNGVSNDGRLLVSGDILASDDAWTGDAVLLIDGSGDQTVTTGNSDDVLRNVDIAKSGGTLTFDDDITFQGGFTHTSGTVDIGSVSTRFTGSDLILDTAGVTFGDVEFANDANFTLVSNVDIDGDLLITELTGTNSDGDLFVTGNVASTDSDVAGDFNIVLNGIGTQTISGADLTDGTVIIDKASGVASLLDDLGDSQAIDLLLLNTGTLDLAGFDVDTVNGLSVNGGTLIGGGSVTDDVVVQNSGVVRLAAPSTASRRAIGGRG